ncbi:MAG: hypothetical protein HXO66_03435 [Rothia sp.]|nr:hypothetical protein [Rothia sp. (in: high G+C Gram-positive bacteria)]
MDWRAVLELVVTVVFLAGIALALLCLVTIHRNPHFSEVQKPAEARGWVQAEPSGQPAS